MFAEKKVDGFNNGFSIEKEGDLLSLFVIYAENGSVRTILVPCF